MVLIVKILSIAIIVYGCVIVLRPQALKKMFAYFEKDNRLNIGSVCKALFGILFIIAARDCRVSWVIFFFGALAVLGGVVGLIMKRESLIKMIKWWEKRPNRQVSMMGLVVVVMGVLMVLAI